MKIRPNLFAIGHCKLRPNYVKFAITALVHNTQYIYTVDSDMHLNNTHRRHFSATTTIMVTRTRHNFTQYVHCMCYRLEYSLSPFHEYATEP